MIDYQEMERRHQAGLKQLESLSQEEREVLHRYSHLVGNGVLVMANNIKAPVSEAMTNAVRFGIAIGLQIAVVNGEVQARGTAGVEK
jgi:hypothetical protein